MTNFTKYIDKPWKMTVRQFFQSKLSNLQETENFVSTGPDIKERKRFELQTIIEDQQQLGEEQIEKQQLLKDGESQREDKRQALIEKNRDHTARLREKYSDLSKIHLNVDKQRLEVEKLKKEKKQRRNALFDIR